MKNQPSHTILRLSDTGMVLSSEAEDIRGRKVVDTDDEEVGEVDELMIDDTEKKVRFIRVASGGFLGMGETRFLIPVDAIVGVTDKTVRVNRGRQHVAAAPAYDPDVVTPEYLGNVYGHYGFTPFWSPGYIYPGYPVQY